MKNYPKKEEKPGQRGGGTVPAFFMKKCSYLLVLFY
jgi:hypothetical protein